VADTVQNEGGNADDIQRRINFNTVAAVLFVAFGIALFLLIPTQIDKPLIVITGSVANLPAELFPKLISAAFLILGVWFTVISLKLRQENGFVALDKEAITNVAVTLFMMALYVPLMVNIGFVVGSAIMVFAMSTYFGNRNYWLGAAISIILPIGMFMMFRRLLLVELPAFPIDIYPLTNWSIL